MGLPPARKKGLQSTPWGYAPLEGPEWDTEQQWLPRDRLYPPTSTPTCLPNEILELLVGRVQQGHHGRLALERGARKQVGISQGSLDGLLGQPGLLGCQVLEGYVAKVADLFSLSTPLELWSSAVLPHPLVREHITRCRQPSRFESLRAASPSGRHRPPAAHGHLTWPSTTSRRAFIEVLPLTRSTAKGRPLTRPSSNTRACATKQPTGF